MEAASHGDVAGRLSASFRAGMRPLAIGTGLVVALAAPTADFLLERGDLSRRAEARARQLAARLAPLAAPGSLELLTLARSEEDVIQARIVDPNGSELVSTPAPKGWPIVWGKAPLWRQGQLGEVQVAVTEPELLNRDLELLCIFGALGASLTLALYFFPLRLFREEDLVRLFARRSITAVDDERMRLARELHDGVAQSIGAVAMTLARIDARAGPSAETAEGAKLIDGALQELRRVLQGLRPSPLDDLGLGSAIEALATELRHLGVEVAVEVPPLPRLPNDVEHACYRLAQEALTNVARHAGAKRVRIALRHSPGELALEIDDDGRGFSPAGQLGLGLIGARERAAAAGGTFTVQSTPGGGTRLRAGLPLPREET